MTAPSRCAAMPQWRARWRTPLGLTFLEHDGSPMHMSAQTRAGSRDPLTGNATAFGEPSFQAHPARARRAVCRARTVAVRRTPGKATSAGRDAGNDPRVVCYLCRARERRMSRSRDDRRRVRLHHRRRRLGRMPARQPALRRCRQARARSRSRRPRQLDLVPHPGRLPVRDRQSALGLVFQDRAGDRASTAAASTIRAAR